MGKGYLRRRPLSIDAAYVAVKYAPGDMPKARRNTDTKALGVAYPTRCATEVTGIPAAGAVTSRWTSGPEPSSPP
jgi:hypothetical protein